MVNIINIVKKVSWGLVAVLSSILALISSTTLLTNKKSELFFSKESELQSSLIYNINLNVYIIFGAIALLIGWTQFHNSLRIKYPKFYKNIGKTYVSSIAISGVSGIYIAFFSFGGIIASAGFVSFGLAWLYTTTSAFVFVRLGQITSHQKMMYLSYSICFAAVTFRLWNIILSVLLNDQVMAYRISAWLCWTFNLIVALYLSRNLKTSVAEYKV
jgi:uncharacterized membrane protein